MFTPEHFPNPLLLFLPAKWKSTISVCKGYGNYCFICVSHVQTCPNLSITSNPASNIVKGDQQELIIKVTSIICLFSSFPYKVTQALVERCSLFKHIFTVFQLICIYIINNHTQGHYDRATSSEESHWV